MYLDPNYLLSKANYLVRNNGYLQYVLVVLSLLIFIEILDVGFGYGVISTYQDEKFWLPLPPDYFREEDLIYSHEYQIALNPKPDWKDREYWIGKWIESMNEYNNYIHFRREDAKVELYKQYKLQTKAEHGCMASRSLIVKVRQYINVEKTTLDLKQDKGEEITCLLPLWPSERFYNQSKQKCEQDVHPCFDKYAKGSKVVFDEYYKEFETCGDLKEVYPDAFRKATGKYLTKPVKKKGPSLWWKLQWKGVAGESTFYKVTYTIQYRRDDIKGAMEGTSDIFMGEWSMRLSSVDHKPYEIEVIEDLESMFYNLILEYDVYEKHWDCAERYFTGDPRMGSRIPSGIYDII